jgi:hypothetical protein
VLLRSRRGVLLHALVVCRKSSNKLGVSALVPALLAEAHVQGSVQYLYEYCVLVSFLLSRFAPRRPNSAR